ncbi:TorF family putative porin [Sphingomonas fennica]|uniref:Uncharacterized protein n=1 Tax=Edaphosphingomonas fennica TaxID=114404 RepID=A0A2T4HMF5_9SPHN|nr:TorF family putative porin [Sphingomonas fennica]PTD16957.1 hypothetical protein CV103_18120 [Sphingomonas fennica]
MLHCRAAPLALALAGAASAAAATSPAQAQAFAGPQFSAEIVTDQRRRGLSWSDGKAAAEATLRLPLGDRLEAGAAIGTLRGSNRHGGADAGLDLDLGYRHDAGPWRLTATVIGHIFPGEGRLDYVEVEAGAGLLIGPAQFDMLAAYAPSQAAIGGDNLHLAARGLVALPGTPFTLTAGIGRSSGDVTRPDRALRLRPSGSYWDYRFGVDHVSGPITLGLAFTTTSIDRPAASTPTRYLDRHTGSKLLARARLSL